jgi:hypothetical protein
MAEQQRQSLCPRLIDYLAIVGARSSVAPRAGPPTGGGNPPVQVIIFINASSAYLIELKLAIGSHIEL